MDKTYQKNFQPCPKCGRIKNARSKTCCFCAGKGRGNSARRQTVERKCKGCGATFEIPVWRAKQNRGYFCCLECKNSFQKTLIGVKSPKWRGGTRTRFGDRSTAWKVARLWAMARGKEQCEQCGKHLSGYDAVIHHKKPYKECQNYIEAFGPNNIVLVCRSCHGKIECLGRNINHKGQFIK